MLNKTFIDLSMRITIFSLFAAIIFKEIDWLHILAGILVMASSILHLIYSYRKEDHKTASMVVSVLLFLSSFVVIFQ